MNKLIEAIARMEGFFVKGSVPEIANNPGDLIFLKQHGAKPFPVTGKDGKVRTYCAFSTPEDGWEALKNQVRLTLSRHPDITVIQFIGGQRDAKGELLTGGYPGWAPGSDANNPASYAAFVARFVGVDANTKLATIV
jgi:hypothetical protein